MAAEERAILFSVRPRFAELLLDGAKTVELRRVRPTVSPGALALIYASAPTCALLGVAAIVAVQVADRDRIWQRHGAQAGVSRAEYDTYFEGASDAVAITLTGMRRLGRPVPLPELRQGRAWFRPPQSFRYLDARQTASLGVQ